ncbi:hypothetical protein [Flavobacterium croceum]|uniref:hypothetical protein n=1 Tax=Flavobacterium croceum TaxID=370975 RepID=UPI0024A7E5FE|nr:hypothetical protein [Flavobacterium croceum]
MNKLFLIFILSLILNSCNQKVELEKYDKNGNLIVYSEQVYSEMWLKNKNLKVTVIDTFCINQKKRAIDDIKKGKLIHFTTEALTFNKISRLLNKYGIQTQKNYSRCARMSGFDPNCYENEMENEIEKRFGKKFIDSLSEIALKEFVTENPDKPWTRDGVDLRKKYNIK